MTGGVGSWYHWAVAMRETCSRIPSWEQALGDIGLIDRSGLVRGHTRAKIGKGLVTLIVNLDSGCCAKQLAAQVREQGYLDISNVSCNLSGHRMGAREMRMYYKATENSTDEDVIPF
jgi:hypothetical protein